MSIIVNTIQSILTNIHVDHILSLCDTTYEALMLNIAITVAPNYLGHILKKSELSAATNNLCMYLILDNYLSSTVGQP